MPEIKSEGKIVAPAEYWKFIQSGLGGAAIFAMFAVADAYRDIQGALDANTRANIELLELHREWFARSQQ